MDQQANNIDPDGQHARSTSRSGRAGPLIAAALALAAVHAGPNVHAQIANLNKDPNQRCMQCHGQAHIADMPPAERRTMVGTWLGSDAKPTGAAQTEPLKGDEPAARPSLLVHQDALLSSPHAKVKCVECHVDAEKLPHAAKLNRATCATACHEAASKEYALGAHQAALDKGDPLAPTCVSCHGGHEILHVKDRKAPQHRLNSLYLCGDCHKKHAPNDEGVSGQQRIDSYLASTHAKAVQKSGLLWAATCSDCHGAHGVLPSRDPASTVSAKNTPGTCGKCHEGIQEIYAQSVHGKKSAENDPRAAICTDCHSAHGIREIGSAPDFLRDVIAECGTCHDTKDNSGRESSYYKTYHESYHGQVTRLGSKRAARCSDCHGAHDILPLADANSRVSGANLIETCAKCHPGADASFVKYDPHADYRDARNYPLLHGVWLYFMIMMSSVFTFFGLHTILWFVKSTLVRRKLGAANYHHDHAATQIRRFTTLDRVNHAFVAITFFGLTATGIPLVFADQRWAAILATMFGGVEAAGLWHRFFAILLIINFVLHFIGLGRAFMRRTCSWKQWLFGPNSLLPRWKDVKDCYGMFLWFFGLGKRPSFDRWTYWEKFDYWAEVGGSMIIGGSGLLLWFPVLMAKIMPGWMFNVAMVVHGYEALLAIGFIFTIHFFNAHVRPGVFPVDEVIFNGSMPEHELKEQRPEEYKRLVESGQLESLRVPAPPATRRHVNLTIAIVSVGVGVVLLLLIVFGGLGVLK